MKSLKSLVLTMLVSTSMTYAAEAFDDAAASGLSPVSRSAASALAADAAAGGSSIPPERPFLSLRLLPPAAAGALFTSPYEALIYPYSSAAADGGPSTVSSRVPGDLAAADGGGLSGGAVPRASGTLADAEVVTDTDTEEDVNEGGSAPVGDPSQRREPTAGTPAPAAGLEDAAPREED